MIIEWMKRWSAHIPPQALQELRMGLLASNDFAALPNPDSEPEGSEARQQSLVRLDAARNGVWLTRNNVGGFLNPETGQFVRYGLCNESAAQNKVIKSSDLIGFKKRTILATDVGTVIAQFYARECKKEVWKFSGNKHETAQLSFINFINANGGNACFAKGPGSFA